ncbi:YndJ family transporter [Paenibacillus sp. GSMTC-2017]|uniref:YndJ family transporter n=1 Tax=Paenibacillus sp. GSMTC-2017 TaxID=2794350 RepID=UPI0018D6435C|nr:YndJ family transporter [Paenibacillus sp. GSMTC-2017]MBH5319436.1 YndJ family transporter [Paenibacillus sp. GSMTC-2017]
MKTSVLPTIIGGIITLVIFFLDSLAFNLVEKFLIYAVFVIVPLVILLLDRDEKNNMQQKMFTAIKLLHIPAALLTLASIMSNKTWGLGNTVIPGTLSLGWVLFTLLLCVYGITIITNHKGRVGELAIGAGLVYFFVGGIWFALYQYQIHIYQVSPSTHALNSVHFHFSSAIVPIFIGMLGRIMTKKSWYPWIVAIDIIGPILIAVGIIFSKPIEYIGVTLFACNIAIYTTYLLAYLRKSSVRNKSSLFLVASCLAFYAIVVISICYPLLKRLFSLTILDFIPIYGSLHAFGFVLFGLIGWIYMVNSSKKKVLINEA